jgi:hypothetical protein
MWSSAVGNRPGACGVRRLQDKQLTQMQTFNIITHRPVVVEPEPAPRRTKIADSRQQFNIVSNLDHSIHHYAPPEERSASCAAAMPTTDCGGWRPLSCVPRHAPSSTHPRCLCRAADVSDLLCPCAGPSLTSRRRDG